MNRKEAVYEKDTDTQSDFYSFFICDWLHYADSVTMDDFHIILTGKRSISVSYQMDSGTQCRTCQL